MGKRAAAASIRQKGEEGLPLIESGGKGRLSASLFSAQRHFMLTETRAATARGFRERRAILWNLRKFADSGKKYLLWKRADVLRKPNGFVDRI